ncbi:acyl-coa n-acyltransferase [Lucifera butyrica]|uniref:Acyl-coa n-acyltransferase n=1 Tax=Lucifera butyrica TaxID=1351585 RepID=A0A498RAP3_9FIRM|nr:phosphatidylglycerol lysyltransferase domain-containing protein [Lucifera butyrica]VBB07362.1 acyl-coa n-acyltransferase [Lucifera butyrica]
MVRIQFQTVRLEDKPFFDRFFRSGQHHNSECTFTYYYMWRKAGNIRWALVDDCLCILLDFMGKPFFFPPYGATEANFAGVIKKMEEYFQSVHKPFYMRGITKPFLELFQSRLPERFSFSRDRDSWDYVYLGADLSELTGRRYSKKRNHINAFLAMHGNYCYRPVGRGNLAECLTFLDRWFSSHNANRYLEKEKEAILDIMEELDSLDIQGAVIEINGRIEAMTLGEAINDTTAVIHAEKANPDIRGLYPLINQQFCRRQWPDKLYINREEDMGMSGLRKAKESYYPFQLLEKYTAQAKE